MRLTAATLLPSLALFTAPGLASAQPSATAPYAPVVVAEAPPERNWGIGVHLGGMGLHPEQDPEAEVGLGGGGVQLRYRLAPRWEIDLSLSHFQGKLAEDSPFMRHTGSVVLGAMFHFNPGSEWLWSAMLGVGGARDQITSEKRGEEMLESEFAESLVRLGVGLERRFDRIGLAAQVFAVGMERNDKELDGPAYLGQDAPVPQKSSGGLFQLAATYYF